MKYWKKRHISTECHLNKENVTERSDKSNMVDASKEDVLKRDEDVLKSTLTTAKRVRSSDGSTSKRTCVMLLYRSA